ncbi:MAG TPA: diguanylate cyclase [Gammaproteobacteria bacterium]|nr:diguanylate cyclase [Gammaproteobacteria bacterium]
MTEENRDRSLDLERGQLRGFARSIAEVELLLLLLVGLYLFVARPETGSSTVALGALLGFAIVVLILRRLRALRSKIELKITLEILAMVVFLTIVLNEIGPDAGPLFNLYLLPIIAASLVLRRLGTFLVTLLVSLCYFLLTTSGEGLDALSPALLIQAAAVLFPFLLVAFLTSLLADNIRSARRRIQTLSDHDEISELLNFETFMRRAERMHDDAARSSGAYAVLMIDIDHLKRVNETYGVAAGNKALQTVGAALLRVLRAEDVAARFGGDEFIALLPNCELTAAIEIAQRLRNLVYASTFEVNVDIVRLKINVGVANFPIDGDTLEHVMTAADRAMYKDKELRTQPDGKLVIQKR